MVLPVERLILMNTPWHAFFELVFPRICPACEKTIAHSEWQRHPFLCPECASKLFPLCGPRCRKCGISLISEENICFDCRDKSYAFDELYPLFLYRNTIRASIISYKSKDRRSLSAWYSDITYPIIESRWHNWTMVPVPPRPGKLRKKGWDQVEAIIQNLERRGVPASRVLRRLSAGEQKVLSREGRQANARASYELVPTSPVPRDCLIFDDISTTKSTIDACATILKLAGAQQVSALVLCAD